MSSALCPAPLRARPGAPRARPRSLRQRASPALPPPDEERPSRLQEEVARLERLLAATPHTDASRRAELANALRTAEADAARSCAAPADATDCINDWQTVLELREARAREPGDGGAAGAPSGDGGGRGAQLPPHPQPHRGLADPLGGLRPRDVEGTTGVRSGSLALAGQLERMAGVSSLSGLLLPRDDGGDGDAGAAMAPAEAERRRAEVAAALRGAVVEAAAACADDDAAGCAAAWDAVEELSSAAAHADDSAQRAGGRGGA